MKTLAREIINTFETQAGARLEVAPPGPQLPGPLGRGNRLALLPDGDTQTRLGDFLIVVVDGRLDPATRVIGTFDAEDNVWWLDTTNELTGEPPEWTAVRDWNQVRLSWHGRSSRRIDGRWRRLVALLEAAGVEP